MEIYTLEDVLGILRTAIGEGGTAAEWAKSQGLSPQYVSDVLNLRRSPGPKLLGALQLERVTTYQAKQQAKGRKGKR